MVEVIAEIGLNHNGSLNLAKSHIEHAVDAGATVAKFQTYYTDERVPRHHPLQPVLDEARLADEEWEELIRFTNAAGIQFLSTAFGTKSLSLLENLGVESVKFASFSISHRKLFEKARDLGWKVFFSTGAAEPAEVVAAAEILAKRDRKHVVFHCISEYPVSTQRNLHLANIQSLKSSTGLTVGFSDHSRGPEAAAAAVLAGAEVIEKHFTVDNQLPGPDHEMSADPAVFRAMVKACAESTEILGEVRKGPYPAEKPIVALKGFAGI